MPGTALALADADGAVDEGVATVGLTGAAVAAPDPDGFVVVEVWLLVEHAPTRAATSPVTAATRHTGAVMDR
ncbi:MAG TPA: hypothetical protein VFN43_01945 [Humibacillus sp.]|nr:hypothetical protein [Humibacillus sp.]